MLTANVKPRAQQRLLRKPSGGLSAEKAPELNQRPRVTVIALAQRVQEPLAIAQRAVVLQDGAVALDSNQPQDLLQDEPLGALFLSRTDSNRREIAQ